MQQLSPQGKVFIYSWEAIKLFAYRDPGTGGEPITIGIGATVHDGQGLVRLGDTITIERALARFDETIARKYLPGVLAAIRVPLTWYQLDMCVSFHYNTGAIRTGSIDDKLNRGDVAAALRTWAQYTKSGGRYIRGLDLRRQAELAVWKTGKFPDRKIVLETSPGVKRYVRYEDLPKGNGKLPVAPDLKFPPLVQQPAPPAPDNLAGLWRLVHDLLEIWLSAKVVR